MRVADLIAPEAVLPALRATSKKQVLQAVAYHAAGLTGVQERRVFDVLVERERLGTTGVGNGIAIPHGKLTDLDAIRGFFARLTEPVDFDAIDDQPVDLVCVLLAPEDAGADHLKALARVSRLLRDRSVCAKLRERDTADAIHAVLTQASAGHPA